MPPALPFRPTHEFAAATKTFGICTLVMLTVGPPPASGQNRVPARVPVISNPFPLPRTAVAWRLDPRPAFDIGGGAPDGPYDLRDFQVRQVANGRLIVTNAATFDVRVYDSLGKHLATVGRRGEGPNEFRSFRLLPAGDTKAVIHDPRLDRITWIDEVGRLGPIVSVSQTARRAGQSRELLAILTDGTAISVERTTWSFVGNSSERDTSYYVAGPLGSGAQNVIAKASGLEVLPSPTRPGILQPAGFGRGVVHAIGGDRLYLARNDRWEVEERRADGTLVRIIRLALPIRPLTPSDERRLRAQRLEDGPELTAEQRAGAIALLAAQPYAKSFPPIAKLFVAHDRTLFVRPGGDPSDPQVLDVFNPNGVYVARLQMPPNFDVRDVTRTRVIGATQDADDIQHLVGYVIRPGT